MKIRPSGDSIARHRFPIDPWRLIETEPNSDDLGLTETLFANANGYLGMRANPSEGRDAHTHGTYLNGVHETWPIHHAEDAFAFAKTGQTIINAPDAKLMKLYVDDEPLLLAEADLDSYERAIDFRTGRSHRQIVWRTPGGKRVEVRSERMVSLTHRHLAVLTFTVTVLDGSAPVVISSQLLNRQDGEDEYHVTDAALGEGRDPRQARRFDHRVLVPTLQHHRDDGPAGGQMTLGYRCANSGMTVAAATRHRIDTECDYEVSSAISDDLAKNVFTIKATAGQPITLTKFVAYHSSRGIPPRELADRCTRTIDRAIASGTDALYAEQSRWLDEYWSRADVEIDGDPAAQQAVRWNLFQLAQASARAHENGVAAKGVTAGGYDGHYFWDTEVYVVPFLSVTNPEAARKLLRFRHRMLPMARERALELNQRGALYPWRTINGEEASAYYAAGTAQYHINAAVAYAIERYVHSTADLDFLADEGIEILIEMARLYRDLGFFGDDGRFHIHSVTGPDEYTTVVNDNLYTNVMARFTMSFAASTVKLVGDTMPDALATAVRRTGLADGEVDEWIRAGEAIYLPYDDELGIHPQDENFLDREPWDLEGTPSENYPLLLHYHPLVIYRHQVLKQADVVLATYLRGQHFTLEQKRRNFEYYDPLTTGDSSLSAGVQSIVAAQIGHHDLAWSYFQQALYLDLADAHGNTADGVHVANAGGIWSCVVNGFAGVTETGDVFSIDPRLPAQWNRLAFRLHRHDSVVAITVMPDHATVTVEAGNPIPVSTDDGIVMVDPGESLTITGSAGSTT